MNTKNESLNELVAIRNEMAEIIRHDTKSGGPLIIQDHLTLKLKRRISAIDQVVTLYSEMESRISELLRANEELLRKD